MEPYPCERYTPEELKAFQRGVDAARAIKLTLQRDCLVHRYRVVSPNVAQCTLCGAIVRAGRTG